MAKITEHGQGHAAATEGKPTTATPPRATRHRLSSVLAVALLVVLVVGLTGAGAAPPAELSRQDASARAAYLYNFLGYIEWPSRALPLTDSPLVIGVVHAEVVAAELLLSTLGRSINHRPVTIRRLQPGDSLDEVHLLYIGPGDPERVHAMISQVPQRWTVTVTDEASSDALAGVINFRHSDGRLRFDVSLAAADRGDFKLSSRLLSLAIVHPGRN